MDPRSPLEYLRDLERSDRDPRVPPSGPSPARIETPTIFETVERVLQRIQPRVVFNPRGRKPSVQVDSDIGRKITSGGSQEDPRRSHEVPRRPKRTQDLSVAIGLQTRPTEQRLLVEVGKFRVISVKDLAREIYNGQESQLRHDLGYLKEHGLIETHFINVRRDGRSEDVRRFDAVTLTKSAQKMLNKSGLVPEGQRIYSGLVKPREAEHDTQIYRAYQKEAAAIESEGGRNLRVKLDFELKAQLNRAMYLARKQQPDRDATEVKAEVADQFNLTVIDDRVVVPDLRIEYDLPSGASAQVDVEVATAAYRHGHIAHKVQAGFRMYVSNGDIGRLGAAIQDDHDLMSEILDI